MLATHDGIASLAQPVIASQRSAVHGSASSHKLAIGSFTITSVSKSQ